MPLSENAQKAVRAAVAINPVGARLLWSILVTAPRAVRYKPEDALGPLGMMVRLPYGTDAAAARPSPMSRPSLPDDCAGAAAEFNQQWLQRRFTKAELADSIARALADIGQGPERPLAPGGWTVVRGQVGGGRSLDAIFPPADPQAGARGENPTE